MTRFVVDASVVIKWFFDEELSANATSLLNDVDELIAPAFLLIEAANVLWLNTRKGEIDPPQARRHSESLRARPGYFADEDLIDSAFEIAVAHSCSVYDCLYVALALREGCQLVTADNKLYQALRGVFPAALIWLGDIQPSQNPWAGAQTL